jgi:hypothetical protein
MRTHIAKAIEGRDQPVELDPVQFKKECSSFSDFTFANRPHGRFDAAGKRTYADGTELELSEEPLDQPISPNVPFWMISAEPSLINGPNDISKPALFDFGRQVISDTDREATQRIKLENNRDDPFACPDPESAGSPMR